MPATRPTGPTDHPGTPVAPGPTEAPGHTASPGMPRRLLTAEMLAIGSELTVGETRDTNTGELARLLTEAGVRVGRLTALPDDLAVVRDAFAAALERSDLVVSTGGLGPTPDDLTREALAALCGEEPAPDPEIERWLRDLWARRQMPFPEINVKQAWLIPSATGLPNRHGTAPGWWVDRPDGRVVVALPGPPREMRGVWSEEAFPRLVARGLGREQCVRIFRLAGIGESQVADRLGETLLRSSNPVVATYARSDAVDVRISAVREDDDDGRPGRSPEELVDEAQARVLAELGPWVWGRGSESWPEALGRRLDHLGWTLAISEIGTGGALVALLHGAEWLRFAETLPDGDSGGESLEVLAVRARARGGADVGVALRVSAAGSDTAVRLAVATPTGVDAEEQLAFQGASQGRARAALLAAAALLRRLRQEAQDEDLAAH